MRKMFFLLLPLAMLLPVALSAQVHGNEWINHNQQYIKIPVGQDGIYKVTYADLQKTGFPVASVNPRNLQLFHRGQEQAVFVEGEGNNIFDPGDFILFYGRKNDGTLDKELYRTPDTQPHAYYNLYSDTTSYFLTFSLSNQAGKRMQFFSENNTENIAPEPYFLEEQLFLYTENYNGGKVYLYGGEYKSYLAYGDLGEGFTGAVISNGQVKDITFTNLTGQVSSGPAPRLDVLLTGRNNIDREVELLAGNNTSSLRQMHSAVFNGAVHYRIQEPLEWTQLGGGQLVSRVVTTQGERVSVAYAKLTYAKSWDMEGAYEKMFKVPAGAAAKKYVSVRNVPAGSVLYDVTNPESVIRIGAKREGGSTLNAMLANGTTERKILLSGVIMPVSGLKKTTFRKINPAAHNFLIVSHRSLRKSAAGYADPVKEYASYRASAAGGNFDTLLVNVGQLYDQFSYGEISPLGIRRFVTYMAAGGAPEYLFLVGKGLDVYYNYHRSTTWTNSNHNLVPTFGFPGGDVPYTAQINGSGYAPSFPVGRLGARSPQEVANYLNKVKEMESMPLNDLSRKSLVHLSGGSNKSQALQFKFYLSEFEQTAEGAYLGGKVETVSKTTDLVVQEVDITKQVNQGVGLVTFFGHSGTNLSDMEIGYVSDERTGYRNKGKYPCILVNGCDAGAIFSTANSITFGEDWIFTADKGALNFIAHTGTGYTNLLRSYSGGFYEIAYADTNYIDASVGRIQTEAIKRFLGVYGISEVSLAQAHEMVLQGDPAVKLFGIDKPDYETNNENLFIHSYSNSQVSLAADSFAIGIITRNFGRVKKDSLQVKVNVFANGSPRGRTFEKSFPSTYYQDTLYFSIRTQELEGPASYRFEVQLNPHASVAEVNHTNNTATLEVPLSSGGTLNLLPHNYGIVQEGEVNFVFQSTNLFKKGREYLLELDTSATFSGSGLQRHTINADVLVNFKASLPEVLSGTADSVVYFWRTKLQQPAANEDGSWARSSFTYIKNSNPGWSQSHPVQFLEDNLEGVELSSGKVWTFEEISRKIEVITFGPSTADTEGQEVEFKLDDVGFVLGSQGRGCTDNSINAVHISKAGLNPYPAVLEGLNRQACGRIPKIINNFIENEIINGNNSHYNLEKVLSEIPVGDYVVLFSLGNVNFELWPPSVKEQLLSFGADPAKVSALTNGEPYILIGRKGSAAGMAKEVYADKTPGSLPPQEQIIQLNHTIDGRKSVGTISSRLIGPAKEWKEAALSVTPFPDDEFELQITGVDKQMEEHLLFSSNESGRMSLEIDAAAFPYLKLKLLLRDIKNMTPARLNSWQVVYEPLPEGVLLPAAGLKTHYAFDEGQEFEPGFRFVNITEYPFSDSLRVDYTFFNTKSRTSKTFNRRILAPAPKDTTHFTYKTDTDGQAGQNDLKIQVNKQIVPETYYNNNILDMKSLFTVRTDTIQPVVDVAFDGIYIANGAIVSPTPAITIVLRDENKYKLKQDTTGINIYLKRECEGCESERVNMVNSKLRWKPATEEQDFRIEFEPDPLADGIYTLQVQGEDASANKAGSKPFSINFEVITESSVTNFYPYPNPFSTSARFVFTLTGSEIPEDIKIRIMTVDGRVVREILKEELGPLRIGHNVSDFAWDGKDEWGDQLANGVYLYKVFIRHSGDSFERRSTKGDKAFREGFGKMYLLR